MDIASSTAFVLSYGTQLSSGTYTILGFFVTMCVSFLVFWFAWRMLHRAIKEK